MEASAKRSEDGHLRGLHLVTKVTGDALHMHSLHFVLEVVSDALP